MPLLCILAVLCLIAPAMPASERAEVKITCPLDGCEFQAVQDFSGYAAGMRLDMRKMGAISQPWALARCPACSFPVYQKYFTDEETHRLKEIVGSERFRLEARVAPAWYALGVVKEEMRAAPFDIAWTYLGASWEAENDDKPDAYARAARRAIFWFDRAADALREQPDKTKDRLIALYLPVELTRRLGDFARAQLRLQALSGLNATEVEWMPAALLVQARLIAAQDDSPEGKPEGSRLK